MSRVQYIGNFKPHASTENEVLRALRWLGHEVTARQEDDLASWGADLFAADVILWTRTKSLSDQIPEGTRWSVLQVARDRGVPTVGYHLDRWWGLARQHEIDDDPFFRVSLLCTADGGHDAYWEAAGVNHRWFPPAVSEFDCYLGTPVTEYTCDLAFVGSWQSYGHPEWWPQRERMLDHVRMWYGDRFRCFPEQGMPAVRGMDLNDLYASVAVVVGDSCLAPQPGGVLPVERYWSDRVPETLGRGGLLVHPAVEGLDVDQLWRYERGDMDDLHAALERALWVDVTQRRIRRRLAIDEIRAEHTYTVRMRELWEVLGL